MSRVPGSYRSAPFGSGLPGSYWIGHLGLRDLDVQERRLAAKAHGRRLYPDEVLERAKIQRCRRELYALGRARVWSDQQRVRVSALNVVRRQMHELYADGLTFDCLNSDDLLAVRERWPGWIVGQPIELEQASAAQPTPEQERTATLRRQDEQSGSAGAVRSVSDPPV